MNQRDELVSGEVFSSQLIDRLDQYVLAHRCAKVRRGAWRGGGAVEGSELAGCVQVVAVAVLGKVALGFEWETCTAVALMPAGSSCGGVGQGRAWL